MSLIFSSKKIDNFIDSKLNYRVFFWLFKKKLNFEVTSNIKYVLKTGNPKESAGKDRTTFSLITKVLKKKPHTVEKDRLVTNGLMNKQLYCSIVV